MNKKIIEWLNNIENDDEFISTSHILLSIATINDYPDSDYSNSDLNGIQKTIINRIIRNNLLENENQEIVNMTKNVILLLQGYRYLSNEINTNKIMSNDFETSKNYYQKYLKKIIKDDEIYLTVQQIKILEKILNKKNICVSTGTSFGKSLLIRIAALLRALENKRTIIISPTISLMNEYTHEFRKMNDEISVSTMPYLNKKCKIYVVTQERINDFNFLNDDCLMIDEAYEMYKKEQRNAITLNLLNKALKKGCEIKLFYPCISDLKKLLEYVNDKYKDSFEFIYYFSSICSRNIKLNNDEKIANIISAKEKTAIYETKRTQFKLADELYNSNEISEISFNEEEQIFLNELNKIYTENYKPLKYLKKGIIISNGTLPKFYRFIVEKMFINDEKTNIIICNNTMSKGVNLKIKHLILNKTEIKNDEFEIKNLLGRTGRYTNNINDSIGKVTVMQKNKLNNIKDIDEMLSMSSNEYIKIYNEKNIDKIDSEIFEKNCEEIKEGKLDINEFIFKKGYNKEKFNKIINNKKDIIVDFYNKSLNNNEKFYDFIKEIYGGEKEIIKRFIFPQFKCELNENQIKLGKKCINDIFRYIFESINVIDNIIKPLVNFLEKDNYIISKSTWKYEKYNEKKLLNDKYEKINNKNRDKVFTIALNEFYEKSSKFYEGSFMLLEQELVKKFRSEINNNFNNELDEIIDEFSLPPETKLILKEKNIKTRNEFIESDFYKNLLKNFNV